MKYLLLIICILALTACQSPYAQLGYTAKEEAAILLLEDDDQKFFKKEYRETYLPLLNADDFDPELFSLYLQYADDLTFEEIKEMVNEGYTEDLKRIVAYHRDPYYIDDNYPLYLQYAQEDVRRTVEYVNTLNYLKAYDDAEDAKAEDDLLILVNKYHRLKEDYVPEDLIDIPSLYGKGKLRKAALEAYQKLYEAAVKDGMELKIVSPYRSYAYQKQLYDSYLTQYSQNYVDTFSARPGFSEHQSGLAVDILTPYTDFDTFEKTQEALWLNENAHKFGFILRYPQDKEAITGYMYEPWHFRYLGTLAEDVYQSGLTYDEYHAFYIEGQDE